MYFTWVFIICVFIYAIFSLVLPSTVTVLGYGLLLLFVLWVVDGSFTIKGPKVAAVRVFSNPIYQDQNSEVQLVVSNPFSRGLQIYIKDEPPFHAAVSRHHGWLVIPAGSSATFTYSISIPKRGIFQFGDLNIKVSGVFKLFQYQYKVALAQKLKVYPNLKIIEDYYLKNPVSPHNEGSYRTRLFGVGGELAKIREFVTGDDYRKINWKATAHAGKFLINEYEPEKDQTVFLVFDTGRLLFDQMNEMNSRFDYILDSAILLVFNALKHGDMVGALSFCHRVERFLPVGKGTQQLQSFITNFFDLEAVLMESDYRNAFGFWQNRVNKRSLLFIYTDLLDQESSRDLINNLMILSKHHLVVCVILRKQYLHDMADGPIVDEQTAYQKGTAMQFLKNRENIKYTLKNHGIMVLEVDATNIQQTVVEHYEFLKKTGRF